MLIAHDGVREERFANLPTKGEARQQVGWPKEGFIAGYMGRLHTMGMEKGVDALIDAAAKHPSIKVALVGGPDDMAEKLRQRWYWVGAKADALDALIRNEEWHRMPEMMVSLLPYFADVKVTRLTRTPDVWEGAYERLLKERS